MNRQEFVERIKENSQEEIFEVSENEKKVLYIINEFKKLFKKMLIQKDCKAAENCNSFSLLAIQTREYYPDLATRINKVLYYYGEVPACEEKIDYLMRMYTTIKEV